VKRTTERWYPLICGLPIGALVGYAVFRYVVASNDEVKDLFTVVLNVSAIVAGFLGTALSVLLTIENRPVIKDLKDAGCYFPLLSYLLSAIKWSFLLVLLSTCGLLIYPRFSSRMQELSLLGWFIVATVTSLACWRVIRLFTEVVKADGKKNDPVVKP
jgi:hypothetical protein